MIPRAIIFAAWLPFSALAQLQVSQFDGTSDIAVGSSVSVGTVSPGDTIETRFHVRNIGAGPATLATLALSGQSFAIVSAPALPYILAPFVGPASEVEFDVDFSPAIIGSFSASLAVNSLQITLQGTSDASVSVALAGSQAPLAAGAQVNFGNVVIGQSQAQTFLLSNNASSSITVTSISVSGSDFSGPAGLTTPVSIGPGQSVPFRVTFAPQAGTPYQGALNVDGRAFKLIGQGLDPPLPSASITLASSLGVSGQPNSITI